MRKVQKWSQRSSPKNSRTGELLASKQIPVLEHPSYSLDLAPCDSFLYPKIKEILKGRHFDDTDDIRSNTMAALRAIPQNQFHNCFEGWTRHWHWCIALKVTTVIFSNKVWGLSKKYLTLFFPGKTSDGRLTNLITVGGGGGPLCAYVICCGLARYVFLS
jgi:hypothetical protein